MSDASAVQPSRKTNPTVDSLDAVSKRKIIAIDGTIGAGKSTLIKELERRICGVGYMEENLIDYTSFSTYNPLVQMYKNPNQNSASTQMHIIRTMNQRMLSTRMCDITIQDRSLFSPLVFSKALHASGHLTPFSRDYLVEETTRCARSTLAALNAEYAGVFYIHAPLAIILERISQRGRPGESNISIAYLKNLEDCYSQHLSWIEHNVCPIVKVQTTDLQTICGQFVDFMNKTLL